MPRSTFPTIALPTVRAVAIGGPDTPHVPVIQYRLFAGIGGGSQPRRMARSRARSNTSNDPEVGGLPAWRSAVASRSCCQPVVTAAEQD